MLGFCDRLKEKYMNKELQKIAFDIRKKILEINKATNEGHITSSFSCVELLCALYFGNVLNIYPISKIKNPDKFIAKGHSTLALYSVLAKAGYFMEDELFSFAKKGTRLGGLATSTVPGVEAHTGSLGHGLSFGVGVALSQRIKNTNAITYVMTGDGECQEGSIWEAAHSIVQFKLNNLVWIIDKNNLQVSGYVDKVMSLGNLNKRLEAIGFDCVEIDGHNYSQIIPALKIERGSNSNKPRVIIANTIKGKGSKYLENRLNYHGKKPSKDEMEIIINELRMV